MRPNATHGPDTPVDRRTWHSALICVVFVIAVALTAAVSSGTPRTARGKKLDMSITSITFSPKPGTQFQSASQTATVTICSTLSIRTATATLNGVAVTYNGGQRPSCGTGDKGTVAMTLSPGWDSLSVNACDVNNNCSSDYARYYYAPPPFYGMTLTANQAEDTFPAHGTSSPSFTVRNTGNTHATVSWRASCAGGALHCGGTGLDTGSFNLDSGATVSTPVVLHDTVPGAGQTTFTAWFRDSSTKRDSVSMPVTVVAPVSVSVAVTLDQSTLALLVVDSTQAHATVTYADSSKVLNAPATWSFTTGGVAAVTSTGFVTAQGLGTTSIKATVGGVSGSATLVVTSSTGIAATMQGINPQGSIARERCLTIAAGDDAAYECGDLRLVHPLPLVRTMNRARAPTLIYNSRHSKPTMLIAVDVLVTNVTPTQLHAALTIGGHTLTRTHTWSSACANAVCRLVIPVAADSLNLATGWYADSLQVTAGTYSASVLGGIAIVNRTTSPFGAGWWLDGVEQLVFTGDTTKVLWVTGDGSTRLYHATGAPDSVFTAQDLVDRPDTLIKSRTTVTWQRHLGNNAIVQFNGAGQHVRTIDRQRDTTRFVYDATTMALDSIVLPTPSATRPAYAFQYDTTAHGHAYPVLKQVQSPGASGSRTTTLAPTGAWQVTQITDPDNTTVGFTWDTHNRIVSRRNRLSDTTTFSYDTAGALTKVSISMARTGEAALVTSFCAAESRTLAACAADSTSTLPLPLARVVTRLDGPRTDSADVTTLFVNRFGAPDTVVDSHAGRTRVMRDATFPAAAVTMIDPTGFELDAVYNSRGLLQSSTAKNPFGTGLDAITRYSYDAKWDFVDTITAPTGEVSYFSYDAATGNRLWQRTGPDTSTKVTFFYNARNQLDSILAPAHSHPQRVAYDATLGNVSKMTTPLGYHTDITRDGIGAETTVATPTDTVQTSSLRKIERLGYDHMGRVLADTSIGAAMAYTLQSIARDTAPVTADTLFTTHAYDAEGRRTGTTALAAWSPNSPPQGEIPVQVIETWSYDAVGRVRARSKNGATDSTFYDPAGNVTRVLTASGGGFSQQFDALNRLTQRSVAARTYPQQQCQSFRPGPMTGGPGSCFVVFPAYPNANGAAYTIPADVASFTYDQAGHLLTADDGDATVHRQYFPDGALRLDSATYRHTTGSTFDHSNGIALRYDLSGRRTQLTLPGVGGTIAYAYSSDNGLLTSVTDPTNTQHRYVYDRAQRVDSVVVGAGSVLEGRAYDDDDREYRRTRSSAVLGSVNQDSLVFDAQGRITHAAYGTKANQAPAETTDLWYTGLGAVLARERRDAANGWETEEFRVDALGNVLRGLSHSLNSQAPQTTALGSVFNKRGALGTRGSAANPTYAQQQDTLIQGFDVDGGTTYTQHQVRSTTNSVTTETVGLSYYSSDGKLRAVQRYTLVAGGFQNGAFEEYRYDALGRRALVVTQRGARPPACDSAGMSLCESLCNVNDCQSKVLWTTWDAQQILKEERGQYPAGGGGAPYFNTVSYVHGLELDHPLAVLDASLSGGLRIPNRQWRGEFESSLTQTGVAADCSLTTGTCQHIAWPAGEAIYSRPAPVDNSPSFAYTWGGTLLADGQDATGQLFRRNRYYDADVGRFTQEDPIGLAGGMNLYGFAAGDPVNSRDPFGLCPPCSESDVQAIARDVSERTKGLRDLEPVMLAVASLPTLGAGDAALSVVSAPRTATFFRGVSAAEAADVAATGAFRAGARAAGNEGKYLTNTAGAAEQWAAQNGAGSAVLRARIPADAVRAFTPLGRIDGIGQAWWAPAASLSGARIDVMKSLFTTAIPK